MTINHTHCCGVMELHGISWTGTAEDTIRAFAYNFSSNANKWDKKVSGRFYRTRLNAFYILTAVVENRYGAKSTYGQDLVAYIKEHKLGEIVESPVRKNPNSKNNVQVWVWAPSRDGLANWWKARMTAQKLEVK